MYNPYIQAPFKSSHNWLDNNYQLLNNLPNDIKS